MKKCPVCNFTTNDNNMNFCTACGSNLIEMPDASQQQQNPYPNTYVDTPRFNQFDAGNQDQFNNYQNQPVQPTGSKEGVKAFLPLILSILSLFLGGLFLAIPSLVLVVKDKEKYKYPQLAAIISVISIILWVVFVAFRG